MFDHDEDDDVDWRDECHKMIRLVAAMIAEYSGLVAEVDSPAGWALTDLRSMNHDLLQALMDDTGEVADELAADAQELVIEFLRLLE